MDVGLILNEEVLKGWVAEYYNDPVDVLRDSTTNLPVEIQCYLKVGDVVVVDKGFGT